MPEELAGGCHCGVVRYRLTRRPMFVNCCHCTDCQRQTGSAFALNALIEASAVELTGNVPEAIEIKTDSGRPHDIFRCAHCRTAVWSDYGRRGYLLFLRVGTLDDPSAVPPDAHIFTRSKLPWVDIRGGAPAFDVFYDMQALWPVESLARRAAAAKR